MSEERKAKKDYRRCPDGQDHKWAYQNDHVDGGQYTCQACGFQCTKNELLKALE